MYAAANASTHVAWMDTTYSWFVCWRQAPARRRKQHLVLLPGDRSTSGYSTRNTWGFIPAMYIWTISDPHPEIPNARPIRHRHRPALTA